jgi:hypothetical protein
MTETAAVSYRKTGKGEWVAYGPVAAFKIRVDTPEGPDTADASEVTVSKRDGTSKVERIARLGRPFTADGQQMVYAYLVPTDRRSSGTCDECGERRAVTTALDSSGITGRVCGRCAGMASYERSYC